jgi:integrase
MGWGMHLVFFSGEGWRSWGSAARPAIPDGMPILLDDDLVWEEAGGLRPAAVVNRWLRELPSSGCPAPSSWRCYARVLRDWLVFLAERRFWPFEGRARLKAGLGAYAAYRAVGPVPARLAASTWNLHVSVLSGFYRWAVAEGYAPAEPFTYRQAVTVYSDQVRRLRVNVAARRRPKPHVTIRYLEAGFAQLFVAALGGLGRDGEPDSGFRGRELVRNAAIGRLALATGLRRQEFTFLLACEIPPLPPRAAGLPTPFPVPAGVTKGGKFRTTWIPYEALAAVHSYLAVERPLAAAGSGWRPPASWGPPLLVGEFDARGGRVDGRRVAWARLGPAERRRLVAPDGGSMLLALRGDGGPFTAWPTVFARTADRIRGRFEPRFPHVSAHRLRHSFAIATLEMLVGGYYRQAAKLVRDTDADAALALYLAKADPLMVLRDLLGHSSVVTTETYLRRLDMTRVYRDAYERAGREHGLVPASVAGEVADELDDELGDGEPGHVAGRG